MLPDNTTPHEIMNKTKPDLSHLWVWGCQCFPIIPPELHTKGGPRQFEAIFVGYEENRIGWQMCDLHGKYSFSRDVIFNKSVPGHLSPRHGNYVDFSPLPPPSIIQDIDSNKPTLTTLTTPTQQPSTSLTPLYHPTLSGTIHDQDTILRASTEYITRTDTNSLPKPRCHYNNIQTITSLIYPLTHLKTQTTMTSFCTLSYLLHFHSTDHIPSTYLNLPTHITKQCHDWIKTCGSL
jgi:hypothetical protein